MTATGYMTITGLANVTRYLEEEEDVAPSHQTGIRGGDDDVLLVGSRALRVAMPTAELARFESVQRKLDRFSATMTIPSDWDLLATQAWCVAVCKIHHAQIKHAELRVHPGTGHRTLLLRLVSDHVLDIEIAHETASKSTLDAIKVMDHACRIILPIQSASSPLYCAVASLALLEALKTSHIFWPHEFTKHIEDLHLMRTHLNSGSGSEASSASSTSSSSASSSSSSAGAQQRSLELERFIEQRRGEKEHRDGVPGKDIDLNQTSEEFLERNNQLIVQRMIPHDDLHKRVALAADGVPQYTRMLVDPERALCSETKWNEFTLAEKLNDVREEAMVLAMERYLLPQTMHSQDDAYRRGLLRICTTITKGWFRQFAVDHYPLLVARPMDLMPLVASIRRAYTERRAREQSAFDLQSTIESRLNRYFTKEEMEMYDGILIGGYDVALFVLGTSGCGRCNNNPETPWVVGYADCDSATCICNTVGSYTPYSSSRYENNDSSDIGRVTMIELPRRQLLTIWTTEEHAFADCSETHTWSGYVVLSQRPEATPPTDHRRQQYARARQSCLWRRNVPTRRATCHPDSRVRLERRFILPRRERRHSQGRVATDRRVYSRPRRIGRAICDASGMRGREPGAGGQWSRPRARAPREPRRVLGRQVCRVSRPFARL